MKGNKRTLILMGIVLLGLSAWKIYSNGGVGILSGFMMFGSLFFIGMSLLGQGNHSWQYCMDEQGVAYRMSNYKEHHRIAWAEVKEVKVVRLIRTMEPSGKHKMDSYIVLSKVSGFVPHEAIMGNLRKKEAVCIPYSEEAKECLQHYMPNLKTN